MTEANRIVSDWLASRPESVDADLMEIIRNAGNPDRRIATNVTTLHTMIGYCIKEWAGVEAALFNTFHEASGTDVVRAAIIYYKTPSIDSRLTLTDEIVQSVMPQPSRKAGGHKTPSAREWIKIKREISSLLKVRNDIAHYPIYLAIELDEQGEIKDEGRAWWQIAESQSEQHRGRTSSKKPLALIDLVAHWIEVREIHGKLSRFSGHIISSQPSKPDETSHKAGSD
jgi:hypothetical protein